jgi:hypothetical protein
MRTISILLILALNFFVSSMAVGAEGFGRLFTTPAERASLDYLRKTTPLPKVVQNQPQEVNAEPVMPSSVSVEGYVKRGDGKKGTVWVNNEPVQEDSASGEVAVGKLGRDSNQVQLKLPASGKNLSLKAGQVYNPETDSVSETSAHANQVPDSGTIGTNPANDTSETERQ